MAAMLERNAKDRKAAPSNVPPREVIHCPLRGCKTSYTLSFTENEFRMVGSETNMGRMRSTAVELIRGEHPFHFTKTYLWKAMEVGPKCGWCAADSLVAYAAL